MVIPGVFSSIRPTAVVCRTGVLQAGTPHERLGYDTNWKLHVNAEVEAEP